VNDFLQRVERAVQQRQLAPRGRKILAAVSGGADSMVLLHALYGLAAKHGWKIWVAHFNHHLRGPASDADERLVRRTAARLRLQFIGGGADVKAGAAKGKLSLEMAARKLRHEFLARTAAEHHISTVALAHHADDQVELFFLRLLRGAGGEGLAGMKWLSPSPADKSISLIRPLLEFSKEELLAHARENKIAFREDASNRATGFLRNRIRHDLLPLLRKKYQPGIDKIVLRLMEIVGAEAEFAGGAAKRFLAGGAEAGSIPSSEFEALPLAVQRKVLQRQLAAAGLLTDFDLVERLRKAPGSEVSVCAGVSVSRDATGKLRCREQASHDFDLSAVCLELKGRQGSGKIGARRFHWRVSTVRRRLLPKKVKASGLREYFDADKVGPEIILRHWHSGDRFQPIGLKSAAKLQDLFVNAKIPAARRRKLVLAATPAGEIFWVEGLRIGESFKLTPQTRRKLEWRAQ
jgi:tRNA(Ile)-lysidine synthase